jgi:dTDP-4-dehydrorhamnose 3,5-epimerase
VRTRDAERTRDAAPPPAQADNYEAAAKAAWLARLNPPAWGRGQWFGVELSAQNKRQVWIPEGFAHGFLALEDDTHFLYKTTDVYAKECEGAIVWNDPTLGVAWPLDRVGGKPVVAAKDSAAPMFQP